MSLIFSFAGAQQNVTVKGKILDYDGIPLDGVSVIVKGTTQGTVSVENGDYSIANVSVGSILEFRLIGFVTEERKVENELNINVVMIESTESLDEVTLVAFGKQKKESVIASITTVNAKDLVIPSSNLTAAFAGRIPGLISYQTSGEPGADNAEFFVRGVTTFGYKQDPLILIDGFEASTDDLARLQPDDIESFSILKDASATVLYGARGANGIIMVNTKSGTEGSLKVSARADVNISTPTTMLELLDGVTYMKMYNEARISRDKDREHTFLDTPIGPWYSEQKIQATARGDNPMIYPNIDWYDMLFKKYTANKKLNINLSGGGKVATYYVAGGVDHETGLLKVDKLNNFNNNISIVRFNIRSNVIFKLTSTTTLDTRITGRFQTYNGPYQSASTIFNMVMDGNPVDFPAVWLPDEKRQNTRHTLFGNTVPQKINPYAEMVRGYDQRHENNISAQATLMQDLDFLTKGLKFQVKASVSTWSYASGLRSYSPMYYALEQYNDITGVYTLYNINPNDVPTLGNVAGSRDGNTHYYFEGRFNWDRQFGKHSIGVMTVGIAEEKVLTNGEGGSIYYTLPERNLGNSGRVSYDYDSRYFAEFAYGYNGSEKFTGKKQFGFFPSFGAGWIVSNEAFWESIKESFGLLKLKYTYGKVGNDAIAKRQDRFFYLSDISGGGAGYYFGRTAQNAYTGYTIRRYANPDISWEVSTKYNLGIELGLLKGQSLNIQADVFYDVRDKIYMARESYPASVGLETTIHGNVGKVTSQGIDGSVDYQYYFNNDFWMTGRVNFTYATNKYVEKDEKNFRDAYRKRVGHPINQAWGLVAERLFVDQTEIDNSPEQSFGTYMRGDIKYLDVNKDGKVNSDDEISMGFPTSPEMQYGFGLSTGYKNLDFSFFFQGNANVSFFINPGGMAPFYNRRNAPKIVALNAWSETNPDVHAFWPRLSTEQVNNNVQNSSWWLREGTFIRLKSIELGYNIPAAKKIGVETCRLYLSCENLFHISTFKLWDPEMGGNGLSYPINRRFNIGLKIAF
ncbi:MAG: TonB-dependent receptor [Tannerella sp.]|jgi:TonB-linked SusC/RagA family outer membrane protein|nr:TonB-dependent receptor [Tannerella sp.]